MKPEPKPLSDNEWSAIKDLPYDDFDLNEETAYRLLATVRQDRERIAQLEANEAERLAARAGVTHSERCWRWHPDCAVAKVEERLARFLEEEA